MKTGLGVLSIVLAATGLIASTTAAQSGAVAGSSYYTNEGMNGILDPVLGEFFIDGGGYVSLAAFDLANNYYQTPCGGSIRNLVRLHLLNIPALQAALSSQCTPDPGFVPVVEFDQALDGSGYPTPNSGTAWFGPQIQWVSGRINGGPFQLVWKQNPNATIRMALFQFPFHPSHLRLRSESFVFGPPSELVRPAAPFDTFPLQFNSQVLNAGDLLALILENCSSELLLGLQRAQDLNRWVRLWFPGFMAHISQPVTFHLNIRTIACGYSWGGLISAVAALLQPEIYSAAYGFFCGDFAYCRSSGDFGKLQGHRWAGFTGYGWLKVPATSHAFWNEHLMNLFEDSMDLRPTTSPADKWSVNVFSLTARLGQPAHASDLKVPIYGVWGDCDIGANFHWSDADAANPNLRWKRIHMGIHGDEQGQIDGKNEYYTFSGGEWAEILANAATGPVTNPDFIPLDAAPSENPDPYTHTLRHMHCPGPCPAGLNLLTDFDLDPDGDAGNVVNLAIGNGVFPGNNDTLRVGDLLGGTNIEVWFGNFDGFFHVLRFKGGASDKYRLFDVHKSPALAYGLGAMDTGTLQNKTVVLLGDAMGQIHRLERNPSGTSFLAPTLFASTATTPLLRSGLVAQLLIRNFDGGTSGNEVLVENEEGDWLMFSEQGSLIASRLRVDLSTPLNATRRYAQSVGRAHPVDLDGDGDLELVMGAQDGHLWRMDYIAPKLVINPMSRFTYVAMTFVDSVHLDAADPAPSHIVALGDRDNAATGAAEKRMLLIRRSSGAIDMDALILSEGFKDNSVAFAWLDPANGQFVWGSEQRLFKLDITASAPPYSLQQLASFTFDSSVEGAGITGIDYVDGGGSLGKLVVVALANGRIFTFDENLVPRRLSDKEEVTSGTPRPWYSNKSFGHLTSADVIQVPGGAPHTSTLRSISITSVKRLI